MAYNFKNYLNFLKNFNFDIDNNSNFDIIDT
uniref:Uncharacterized protein n=1 Tax=Siphoviridae sp. ctHip2 TaxID=2827830 RepID=A0A8S5RVY2_9CAUD|nr:MAG TPA: hypothetical protein [Siphoviridae sp. ctHip2]